MKPVVWVVDGWDPVSGKAFARVFRKSKRARRSLRKLYERYPEAYAGVVRRVIR